MGNKSVIFETPSKQLILDHDTTTYTWKGPNTESSVSVNLANESENPDYIAFESSNNLILTNRPSTVPPTGHTGSDTGLPSRSFNQYPDNIFKLLNKKFISQIYKLESSFMGNRIYDKIAINDIVSKRIWIYESHSEQHKVGWANGVDIKSVKCFRVESSGFHSFKFVVWIFKDSDVDYTSTFRMT